MKLILPVILLVIWLNGGSEWVTRGIRAWLTMGPDGQQSYLLTFGTLIFMLWIVGVLLWEISSERKRAEQRSMFALLLGSLPSADTIYRDSRQGVMTRRYGKQNQEFISMALSALPPSVKGRELKSESDLLWELWQKRVYDIDRPQHRAEREAKKVVVAYYMGQTIISSTIARQDKPTVLLPSLNMLPEDNAWAQLVVDLVCVSTDNNRKIARGDALDVTPAVANAAALVTHGRTPTTYDGDLTIDSLLTTAGDASRAIIDRNLESVQAITKLILSQKVIGPHDVRRVIKANAHQEEPQEF